jgi:hypothetical protein
LYTATPSLYTEQEAMMRSPMPLLAPLQTASALPTRVDYVFPIELSASKQNHYTQNRLRHEPACAQPPRLANIWSIFALHPEDTMMMGLGEVTNLKIHRREGVE